MAVVLARVGFGDVVDLHVVYAVYCFIYRMALYPLAFFYSSTYYWLQVALTYCMLIRYAAGTYKLTTSDCLHEQ